jgi:hypothetical protein
MVHARLGRLLESAVPVGVGDRLLALGDLPLRDVEAARDLGDALLHDRGERRDDRDLLREQQLDGGVAHRAAVFDHVDPELGHAVDAGVEGRVGGDREPVAVALVDHGRELLVGELEAVVAAHDLDQVRAAAHLFAHRAPHLVGAGGLAAAPVGVAAGLHDRLAGDQDPRAGEDALLERLLGEQVAGVHPQVAHERDAGAQRLEHVGRRLVGADLGGVVHRLPREVVDAVPRQVGVRVDQPGRIVASPRSWTVRSAAGVPRSAAAPTRAIVPPRSSTKPRSITSSPTHVSTRPSSRRGVATSSKIGAIFFSYLQAAGSGMLVS